MLQKLTRVSRVSLLLQHCHKNTLTPRPRAGCCQSSSFAAGLTLHRFAVTRCWSRRNSNCRSSFWFLALTKRLEVSAGSLRELNHQMRHRRFIVIPSSQHLNGNLLEGEEVQRGPVVRTDSLVERRRFELPVSSNEKSSLSSHCCDDRQVRPCPPKCGSIPLSHESGPGVRIDSLVVG
jgi:hypothetical protein